MSGLKTIAALALFTAPACVFAADGTVHRLSAEEIERAKDAGATRARAPASITDDVAPDRKVHGEVGFAVGTGGYTSVFGSAFIPLSEDSFAAFAFEQSDFGTRRHWKR